MRVASCSTAIQISGISTLQTLEALRFHQSKDEVPDGCDCHHETDDAENDHWKIEHPLRGRFANPYGLLTDLQQFLAECVGTVNVTLTKNGCLVSEYTASAHVHSPLLGAHSKCSRTEDAGIIAEFRRDDRRA